MSKEETISGMELTIFVVFLVGFSMGIGSVLFDSIRGVLPIWLRPLFLLVSCCCGVGVIVTILLLGYDKNEELKGEREQ